MQIEEFRAVKDYEGYYEISNLGRLKSLSRLVRCNGKLNSKMKKTKEKIMSPVLDKDGYVDIIMQNKGMFKHGKIHRLVAFAFIPNPKNYKYINHKNEIKDDNNVINLEWCTQKYNNSYNNGMVKRNKLKRKPIIQYDLDMNIVNNWDSTMSASRNGFCSSNISSCLRGVTKTHKGFKWEFA